MVDSSGAVTTYHSECKEYCPDTSKPQKVRNTLLGVIFDCKNFSPKENLADHWQHEVDGGKKFCFTCINHSKVTNK